MASFRILQQLPEELLQDVIERLSKDDLRSLNLTCRWCYQKATTLIWREVDLVDCRTNHEDGVDDHHDDTPLLRKLLILARNPWIASCVQTVTHKCHLPPPAIFYELPRTPFSGMTLSCDPRTTKLVQLAVRYMSNVHTLRIIFGHPNINDALLRLFFDKARTSSVRIRRLWLENCRISAGCDVKIMNHRLDLPLELDFSGLESIRLRRLPVRPGMLLGEHFRRNFPPHLVNSRGGLLHTMQNGTGGTHQTTATIAWRELESSAFDQFFNNDDRLSEDSVLGALQILANDMGSEIEESLENIFERANMFDDKIYAALADDISLPSEVSACHISSHRERCGVADRGFWLDPHPDDSWQLNEVIMRGQREKLPSSHVMLRLLNSASATLTNLCLDWVFTKPYHLSEKTTEAWLETFKGLFRLRFPQLRAFQFRNAVVEENIMPTGLYLLDHAQIWMEPTYDRALDVAALEFMEAHENLQCLAWPMDSFFSEKPPPADIADRVQAVIANLGRTLIDLRVDSLYNGGGELQTENHKGSDRPARDRRRQFIAHFASKMTKVESIKIEGGVPRDERRETIRALHACPLKKIVMIGVCSPVGNTWDEIGLDMTESLGLEGLEYLEGEHKEAVRYLGTQKPEAPPANFRFEPMFGWPPAAPMISTIASFHADTITELKFCGYKGAPVLFQPTSITAPMLHALKYFNQLESLIVSMWLNTRFEGSHQDNNIIDYWLDARSPSSTALVSISDEGAEGWEKELKTKYAPNALAWEITRCIGPFLSPQAKARKGGVHVRASVCIGDAGGIFDTDLQVGKGSSNSDVCLSYTGPREEIEPERRRIKLEGRRWF